MALAAMALASAALFLEAEERSICFIISGLMPPCEERCAAALNAAAKESDSAKMVIFFILSVSLDS